MEQVAQVRYRGDPRRVAIGDKLWLPGEGWHVTVTAVAGDLVTVRVSESAEWTMRLWELDGWTVTYSPRDVAGI